MSGWIHTLLEEAENERQHLLTFLHLRQPGLPLRAAVLLTQVRVCVGGGGGVEALAEGLVEGSFHARALGCRV